eukprot:tig00000881_g5218.t1
MKPTEQPAPAAQYGAPPTSTPYGAMPAGKRTAAQEWEISIRMGFLRKVYGILAIQLTITSLMAALIMTVEPLRQFARSSQAVLITASLLPIVILFVLMCVREQYPLNMGLLGLFTLCFGYTVGTICSFYSTAIVLEAVCLTAAIVVALTLYTFQSKRDFSFLGAGLFAALFCLLIAGFVQIFVRSPLFDFLLSVAGAVVFSLYIVYDTHRTMHVHSVDEYIMAVISLYLDIINLFLNLLKILQYLQRSD